MKKKLLLSLLLCTGLLLTGCSKGMVIATVNGTRVYESSVRDLITAYFQYYGVSDPTSSTYQEFADQVVDLAVETAVQNEIVAQKVKEYGLDVLSEDEKAEIESNVDQSIQSLKDQYYEIAKQADPDGTEESWQQTAQDNVDNYFKDNDVSRESLIEDWTASKQATKLYERVTENITVTEEEVQDEYDTRVAEMKETYAESPNSFEQDMMNGATIYYRPAGFREIKQILIAFNEEDSETIATLQNQGDTQGAEEAKKAALANIQEKAQGVLDSLKKDGSNFDEVMKENTDDTTTEPYAVGNLGEDTSYMEAFTQAAFALQKPGDISGLVATDYGYHILCYAGDIQEGAVPFEEVKAYTEEQLLSSKKQEAYQQQLEAWQAEMDVEIYADRIDLTKYKSEATSTTTGY